MNTGTIKNVLDAVRDWVNNKEQAYKPGEIYETVPDEIIKMLWDGDVVFGELLPVSGARGLYPVDPVTNYLHFLEIFYGREETINMIKQNALTFTNIGNNAVSFKFYSENNVDLPTLYVVDDEEGLVELKINETYTIPAGGSIKIVGNNPKGNIGVDCTRGFADWTGDTTIKVSGKLTSLIDVMGMTDVIPSTADFSKLFYSAPITDASELVLPNNVAPNCYKQMFSGCTSMVSAPELPANKLSSNCYEGMFNGCTSLTTAPELPATTLANYCYSEMFYGCSALTTAPELPATKLTGLCYQFMFYGCSNLNYIKCLAVNGINTNNSTYNWVYGVPSSGTFVKASSASWPTGVNGIPSGWTIENI